VKVALALEKIAELEGVEVSESEIEAEYNDAAERYSMEVDKLKESVPLEDITRDLRLRNAAKIVINSAVIDNSEFKDDASEAKGKNEPAAAKQKKPAAKKTAKKSE
jgi:trigger factor